MEALLSRASKLCKTSPSRHSAARRIEELVAAARSRACAEPSVGLVFEWGDRLWGRAGHFITRLGGSPRRLTHRGGFDPSWLPHGTKLAFIRQVGSGPANVYLVRRNGRGVRRLTRRGGYGPAWSPGGKKIAFLRDGDLWVIRTDGRGGRRLVDSPSTAGEGPQVGSIDWQALRG